jgi:hypothetical protein
MVLVADAIETRQLMREMAAQVGLRKKATPGAGIE